MPQLDLSDSRIDSLISLVKDSFRVRPNHDPVYVDVGGNLARIAAPQHQVVFGRRGSGKSCLLVHFHRRIAAGRRIKSMYIDVDEIKRLGYPDVLIRLLLTITERLPGRRRRWYERLLRRPSLPLEALRDDLRQLLDLAASAEVTEEANEERIQSWRLRPVTPTSAPAVAAAEAQARPERRSSRRRSSTSSSGTCRITSACSAMRFETRSIGRLQ